jgi:hypothetical protein
MINMLKRTILIFIKSKMKIKKNEKKNLLKII